MGYSSGTKRVKDREPCIKIGSGLIFGTVRLLRIFFYFFLGRPPPGGYLLRRGLIMTPAVNYNAFGYCCGLVQCEKQKNSAMYQDRV